MNFVWNYNFVIHKSIQKGKSARIRVFCIEKYHKER